MIGIYKIINPKGKVYIGQSTNIEGRWEKGHKYLIGSGFKLSNSLKKYGFENHMFKVIEECKVEDLENRETYWINQYDSYNKGLNSTSKGGFVGYRDMLHKQKQSNAMKGRKGYWEGKKRPNHSEYLKNNRSGFSYERTNKHREKISKIVSSSWEKDREERSKKISQNKMGKGTKSIICIETNETFNSIKECSEKMNISKGCICSFVKGKYPYPTLRGYTFSYTKDFESR